MQVNPLFSSSIIDQQAAHIPTMEDIDVLLSPMDQQYQMEQHSDVQQQEGGSFDRQVTCGCGAADCDCAGGQQECCNVSMVGGLPHRCSYATHVASIGGKLNRSGPGVRLAVHMSKHGMLPAISDSTSCSAQG